MVYKLVFINLTGGFLNDFYLLKQMMVLHHKLLFHFGFR